MVKPVKLILVSAEHHPYHKKWVTLTEEVAKEVGVAWELRLDDYVFAIEHGVTDDLGMAGLPQLFVELDNNEIKLLLHEIPLNKAFQPDFEEAKKQVLEKLKSLTD